MVNPQCAQERERHGCTHMDSTHLGRHKPQALKKTAFKHVPQVDLVITQPKSFVKRYGSEARR